MLEIACMTALDIDAVSELEKLCFAVPWSENALSEELTNPDAVFLVAKNDGFVAGYCGCINACGSFGITNICVHPSCRQQGIASALLDALKCNATEQDAFEITLEVRVSNENAIRLYEKNGFVNLGKRPRFYENPTEDAYIMTLTLK